MYRAAIDATERGLDDDDEEDVDGFVVVVVDGDGDGGRMDGTTAPFAAAVSVLMMNDPPSRS